MRRPILQLKKISKRFVSQSGEQTQALRDVSLCLEQGSVLAVVGPSGCGKSTLLRIAAGLEQPDSGDVLIGGESVLQKAAAQRGAAMVFQRDALFSHMTVYENIASACKADAARTDETVRRLAKQLEITDILAKKPAELSGGQSQRVDIARALASGARLILFDEPFSQLDGMLRAQLRQLFLRLQRETGFSALYVTHDISEAFALAQSVAVMKEGEILQLGTPQQLAEQPCCDFVKEFVGAQLR